MPDALPPPSDRRPLELVADCSECFGLCCVAPAFAASSDFAIDKPAGRACPNLHDDDFSCTIHTSLRSRGFPGCTVYDCFGAGQHLAQDTFGGHSWRERPETAGPMFDAFHVMRQLHELLWYLTHALTWPAAAPLHTELEDLLDQTEGLSRGSAADLGSLDVRPQWDRVNVALVRTSELVRAQVSGGRRRRTERRGADLMGKDLRRVDLRGSDLRGAYLIGADLRGNALVRADLIGADLRGADVRGTDLSQTLFLTQMQVNAALGDDATGLPQGLSRPTHWGSAARR
jgi:uncharacterized protein YjbI with pentapeptide repeats